MVVVPLAHLPMADLVAGADLNRHRGFISEPIIFVMVGCGSRRTGSFPFLISPLFFLSHATPSGEMAHQVCCQLAVISLLGTR